MDSGRGGSSAPACSCGEQEVCAGGQCVALTTIRTIAAGDRHTCRVHEGRLFCWGDNRDGQLGPGAAGDSVTQPNRVGTRSYWLTVAAGSRHTCALRDRGGLRCWGDDTQGQLGGSNSRSPDQQPPWDDFLQLECGGDNCCALRKNGELYCWGSNRDGSAGVDDENLAKVDAPTLVVGEDLSFITFSVGAAHSCAIATDHTLWCWGSNDAQQLGLPDRDRAWAPTQVGDEADWQWIAAGGKHTCGIRSGNVLYCWGDNTVHQVGIEPTGPDGDVVLTNVPMIVNTADGWVRVAAGGRHSCSIKSAQELYCWGSGEAGQLGTADAQELNVPTQVLEAMPWRELALGAAHSCALDGSDPQRMYCWGANDSGQLGLGDTQQRADPGEVVLP